MKKISKKIVSLVTLAAFALTLVPAAAFAADTDFSVTQSNVKISKVAGEAVTAPTTAKAGEEIEVTFEMNDKSGAPIESDAQWGTGSLKKNQIKVWVEDEDGNYQDALDVTSGLDDQTPDSDFTATVTIARAGNYTIHAGIGADIEEATKTENEFGINGEATTVEVYSDATTVQSIGLKNATALGGTISNDGEGADENLTNGESATLNYTSFDQIPANGIAEDTITGYAYSGKTGEDAVIGTTLDLQVVGGNGMTLDKTQVTTDRDGKFEFKIKFTKAADYKVIISNADLKVTLNINRSEKANAETIETTVNDGQTLLAGNDTNYTAAVNDADYFVNAVQFAITDEDGNAMSGDLNEPAFTADANNLYVSVEKKPTGSKLTKADLKLVWNEAKEVYTLNYVDTTNKAIDLIPGEYTVSVALKSGDRAEANFTIDKFGTVTGMVIDSKDTVVLGGRLVGTVKYVDENGIEQNAASDVTIGYSGAACKTLYTKYAPKFAVRAYDDDKYLGSKIVVTAVDESNGQIATKEITVVDGVTEGTLAFDPTTGPANEKNTVNVTVVDEEENVLDIDNASLVAYVADQSNEDAVIDLDYNKDVNNGKGKLTIYSDKETTVDVVVAVTTADKNEIYANTLSYTVGEADVNADKLVAMTIGSSDYIVNNDVVKGDAAPYVDGNWRTMVPVRALAETFGAEVTFEDNVITIVDGDKTIVMTVGEEAYTVNDEEKTMDTVPVIGEGDRTFVPTRFVAEALGYTVTPLQDANGLTASVVFQK